MKLVVVDGPPGETGTAVDRLADRLAAEGTVAVVTEADDPGGTTPDDSGAASRYVVGDGRVEGKEPGDVATVLDRLAPEHDYAVLEGFPDANAPRVRVGGERAEAGDERVVATPTRAEALDVERVVEALAGARPRETLESLVAAVKRSPDADRAGAIATFTGRVRTRDGPNDPPTEYLEFEAHDELAERRMVDLRLDLEARDGVWAVRLHHRRGVVEAGEDIVFVVVLAGHRSAAFRAVEDGIDRLKAEVPLFKREVTAEGEFWAHRYDP
ncbi:molybdopterin synthase [Halobacteriales archaeon SW_5_70_135]|nr:MAG: molybdopterin synthase [Halobacteriales archaeon SW_5_70_135]